MTLQAGSRLGPYEILAPLGVGGMGEVYRAQDFKLNREVAIKVLPPAMAADPEALARFEREAKAVAALSHPNILSIFDYGREGDVAYAVVELLDGETLSAKLASGPLPVKQAVDYALQVAKGLAAAHEKGIIHRDLKPANLFIGRDGHVKILDFGLAKRQEPFRPGEETSAPTSSGHTEPGTLLGTMGYMSPEQVRGLPLDSRSDIFSFGAILYEMLSGRRAFKRDTAVDTMSAITRDDPPDLTVLGLGVSPALDRVVKHCLEKERENRFQMARDIAFALTEASAGVASGPYVLATAKRPRWVAPAAAVVVLLAAVGLLLWRRVRPASAPSSAAAKRIAVLPFENQGAPEDGYFADGMSDDVRTKLTSLPGLEVIARGSSTEYKKTTKKPKQIADELGVRYLLTATVRWQKGAGVARVHVTPELVEISDTGAPASKWEQPFDAAVTDVFQVQSDIASKVADSLGLVLGEAGKQLSRRQTENLAAYDAFLKAQEEGRTGRASDAPSLRAQLALYEQAVALDPGFVEAWARLSLTCSRHYFYDDRNPELKERAEVAAKKAYALAPDNPISYVALGAFQYFGEGDSRRALEEYNRGLQIAPQNAELLARTGAVESSLGRWDDAVARLRQAQELDPRQVAIPRQLGEVLLWLRRYPEAREVLDQALALTPDPWTTANKVRTFLGQGDLAGARAVLKNVPKDLDVTVLVSALAIFDVVWVMEEPELQLLLRVTPAAFNDDKGFWHLALAEAFALKGDGENVRLHAEAARKELENQTRAKPDDPFANVVLGLALGYLGRKDDAVREGLRGVAVEPVSRDAEWGSISASLLIRIYLLVGEDEKALDSLERALKIPGYLSPGWLRIDPYYDPLRKDLRFQKLIAVK